MASNLPSYERTWTHWKSTWVGAGTALAQYQGVMWKIVSFMKLAGATIVRSSDSSTYGDSDKWLASTNFVWNAGGSPYSWAVFSFLSNRYMRIGMNSYSAGVTSFDLSDATFTGGSTTSLPTQARSIALNNNNGGGFNGGYSDTNRQFQFHGMYTTTGALGMRLYWHSAGNCCGCLIWESMTDTYGADPGVVGFLGNQSSGANASFTYWYDTNTSAGTSISTSAGSALGRIYLSSEMCGAGTIGRGVLSAAPDSKTGNWPMNYVGVYCPTTGHYGRRGRLQDMYWGSTGITNGDLYPSDGTALWVQYGNLIVPNDGNACPVT